MDDIAVPQGDALPAVKRLALEALLANPGDAAHGRLLRQRLDEISA